MKPQVYVVLLQQSFTPYLSPEVMLCLSVCLFIYLFIRLFKEYNCIGNLYFTFTAE